MTRQALFQLFQLCPTTFIQHIPRALLCHTGDDLLNVEYLKRCCRDIRKEPSVEILRGELHFCSEGSRVTASVNCMVISKFSSNDKVKNLSP